MAPSAFSLVFEVLLVVVMFGLGLGLVVADFTHVLRVPRAVVVTLLVQVLLLPVLCFALVVGIDLHPSLAVGMMLLAASPGGPMAGVFSHLAGGDVALNITVTAINTVLAVVTLPVVAALAARWFLGGDAAVLLHTGEVLRFGLMVLAPVAAGMAVRRRAPALADRVERPLRTGTVVVVGLALVGSILPQADGFVRGMAAVGVLCLLFCVLCLGVGYVVPQLARLGHGQAVAAALEIGIHNSLLAVTVAFTVLGDPLAAVPGAMYGTLKFLPAAAFVWLVRRSSRQARPATT